MSTGSVSATSYQTVAFDVRIREIFDGKQWNTPALSEFMQALAQAYAAQKLTNEDLRSVWRETGALSRTLTGEGALYADAVTRMVYGIYMAEVDRAPSAPALHVV